MIILKSPEEIDKMSQAGKIVADALEELRRLVRPGVTTHELDMHSERFILDRGAKPAFKGYRDFPASLCASVNEEVVHGIPSKHRILQEGDIIGMDLGAIVDGYYGDAAITVAVGKVDPEIEQLLKVTEESLYKGILKLTSKNRLSDISHAIQSHVEAAGYSVVRDFVGHGIGRDLHEDPQIPNYGSPDQGPRLMVGMVLAIEPMVNMRESGVKILSDNWTAVTKDGSLSAHFEHTVAITDNGPKILTKN
jgi:methionyl aminopeptidase